MKGFFVTGTDTGVGKTIIAGALIKMLCSLGLKTGAMKPVESGCARKGKKLIPTDGLFLKQISRMRESLSQITPCCFESPLAPLPASVLERKRISVSGIQKTYHRLAAQYDAMIVEGVGGLMVPLKKNYFVTDLAKQTGLPLIVVAKPGLGSLNHTLLTVSHAVQTGLTVAGIIINYSKPPEHSLAEETNPKLLQQICPAPLIGVFPFLKKPDERVLGKTALQSIDCEAIKKYLQL